MKTTKYSNSWTFLLNLFDWAKKRDYVMLCAMDSIHFFANTMCSACLAIDLLEIGYLGCDKELQFSLSKQKMAIWFFIFKIRLHNLNFHCYSLIFSNAIFNYLRFSLIMHELKMFKCLLDASDMNYLRFFCPDNGIMKIKKKFHFNKMLHSLLFVLWFRWSFWISSVILFALLYCSLKWF